MAGHLQRNLAANKRAPANIKWSWSESLSQDHLPMYNIATPCNRFAIHSANCWWDSFQIVRKIYVATRWECDRRYCSMAFTHSVYLHQNQIQRPTIRSSSWDSWLVSWYIHCSSMTHIDYQNWCELQTASVSCLRRSNRALAAEAAFQIRRCRWRHQHRAVLASSNNSTQRAVHDILYCLCIKLINNSCR